MSAKGRTARTRALCCECGDLRTVSTTWRGGDSIQEPGGPDEATSPRMVGRLKCSHCRQVTVHAILRTDPMRDWVERWNHVNERGPLWDSIQPGLFAPMTCPQVQR